MIANRSEIVTYFFVIAILCAFTIPTKAQILGGFFDQSNTRTKYLLEQNAKLKLYLELIQKGYIEVQKGLSTIGDIKNGDFNLHNFFFEALQRVNPKIKSYYKIADILLMQQTIEIDNNRYQPKIKGSAVFNFQEIKYLISVLTNLITELSDDISRLTNTSNDGWAEMNDFERLKSIDDIYASVSDKYKFMKSFEEQIDLQILNRTKTMSELQDLQNNYTP